MLIIGNVCRVIRTCPLTLINRVLTKKDMSTNVIDAVYRHCGQKETVIFADRMMALGFTLMLVVPVFPSEKTI